VGQITSRELLTNLCGHPYSLQIRSHVAKSRNAAAPDSGGSAGIGSIDLHDARAGADPEPHHLHLPRVRLTVNRSRLDVDQVTVAHFRHDVAISA
jgi:hypothetical protein